ncbi:potassium channel family protein [Aeromicrobium sp.]|uniref:potassium channel family protein n=1 Tax=Aeromicrobium sp. TaxID=1871063 RepID=UPI003C330282
MMWIASIIGALMIGTALRDVFHTLWHPGGFGSLTRLIFTGVWRATKLIGRKDSTTTIAGPLGLLATLGVWTTLLVCGFGLLYWPHMPSGFNFGSSLTPLTSSDLWASLYLSVVALTTLGLGDIQPDTALLRLLVPMEALFGFLLLTAGISWILQLYPALIRRRALARRLTTMAEHRTAAIIEGAEASVAVQYLEGVRGDLASAEIDLMQYGESYYFREVVSAVSLAASLAHVPELVEAGLRSSSAEVRNAARMLNSGLDELLALLRRDFLGDVGDQHHTLAAFARDHQQPFVD